MTKGNREAEKKRLVEALIGFPLMDCALISRRDAEDLADKLIDTNGVIVPPCKVGDVVFAIIEGRVLEGKVDDVWFDDDIGRWEFDVNTGFGFPMFLEESIGTKVFFSRKEAERVLKECSE